MRSYYCGELNESHVDEEIPLCGWVHRRRDHGGVIFLDLRDREGIAQVVFDPDLPDVLAVANTSLEAYRSNNSMVGSSTRSLSVTKNCTASLPSIIR